MSSSSEHEKIDEIMSNGDSDDDDFMLVYVALELMGDNYDSHANKAKTLPVMPGIVWVITMTLMQTRLKHYLLCLELYGLKYNLQIGTSVTRRLE
jgi:hypothetical protein